MFTPGEKSSDPSRQYIKKQRHYFANKGSSSQSYGFSSSHVLMWELDYKESWAPKNWCFWTVVLEKTLESPFGSKDIQPVHPKGKQSWIFIGRTDAEVETPVFWPCDGKNWLIWKDPDAGKDWRREEKGTIEDEMVGRHHGLNGHEIEWTLGLGDGQGSLVCCSPCSRRKSYMTEQLNWTEVASVVPFLCFLMFWHLEASQLRREFPTDDQYLGTVKGPSTSVPPMCKPTNPKPVIPNYLSHWAFILWNTVHLHRSFICARTCWNSSNRPILNLKFSSVLPSHGNHSKAPSPCFPLTRSTTWQTSVLHLGPLGWCDRSLLLRTVTSSYFKRQLSPHLLGSTCLNDNKTYILKPKDNYVSIKNASGNFIRPS